MTVSEIPKGDKPREATANRWIPVFGGFLLALMGGVAYAWGVFVIPLVERFGWTIAEATLPISVFFLALTLTTVPAGRLQDKLGPRKVATAGALLFIIGYGGAALVGYFPYVWWIILFYGVIAGIACGMTYACVAPQARKWYPDKPGTAIAFAVAGFGLAAVFFAPLKADYLIPLYGIEGTFLILGVVVSVVSLLAARISKNPPEGWIAPKARSSKKSKMVKQEVRQELPPRQLFGKPLFWIIWFAFLSVMAGGLLCIGLVAAYGKEIVGLTVGEAAWAMAVFAGFNGFGRPLAGLLSDRYGVANVMIGTYIIQAAILLSFTILATTLPTLYLAAAMLGWGFAVSLAAFPFVTSICFGVKNLGVNYGLMLVAFGFASFASPVGGWLLDITGSYTPAFVSAGVLAVLGLVLCVVLKTKYGMA